MSKIKVFFTSDEHYSHRNILKYCKRPFDSVEEMNEEMINRHNEVVGEKDWVYHIGDFYCGKDKQEAKDIFNRLNGNKVLIKGNHDKKIVLSLPWKQVHDVIHLKLKSVPNAHLEGEVFLSHYAHRVWNKSYHEIGHLFGHSHGGLDFYRRSFDIGVDCHNFYPISWERVQDYFDVLGVIIEMKLDAEKIRQELKEDPQSEFGEWMKSLKQKEGICIKSIMSRYGIQNEKEL